MARILLASLIGAVVAFGWGFVAWPMMNLYQSAFNTLPNEDVAMTAMKAQDLKSGLYVFPAPPKNREDTTAMESWRAKYTSGPAGFMFYQASGGDPDETRSIGQGLGINLIACFLLACTMVATRQKTWGMRFTVAVMMAAFAVMVTHAYQWNWFHFSDAYAMAMATDTMVTWLLAGAVVAIIAKPPAASVM